MSRSLDSRGLFHCVARNTWRCQLRGRRTLDMSASFPTFSTPAEINVVDRLWRLGCPAPADLMQAWVAAAAGDLRRRRPWIIRIRRRLDRGGAPTNGKVTSQRLVASDRDMTPRDRDRASLALNRVLLQLAERRAYVRHDRQVAVCAAGVRAIASTARLERSLLTVHRTRGAGLTRIALAVAPSIRRRLFRGVAVVTARSAVGFGAL